MAEADLKNDLVLVDRRGAVAHLTLNRPEQYNPLSFAMIRALGAALQEVGKDPAVRVIVLGGAGKAFCAGHDLGEMVVRPERAFYEELFAACSDLMMALPALPQPVIARVHGTAAAAGCQLVGMCDLAIASDKARFAVSGIAYGLFCSTPSVALVRNMPRKPAMEMLLTGEFIDAATATTLGLVNRAVPADRLDDEIAALCAKIISKPAISIARGKELFYAQSEQPIKAAYRLAEQVMADNMMDAEAREGFCAFLEKRPPSWRQ